jgi:LysM repeat protein
MGIVFDNSILMKQTRHFTLIRLLLLSSFYVVAQTPESFTNHKVRKGETLELIIEHYGIDELQLKEYNPSVERFGIRRRMNLRIPSLFNPGKSGRNAKSRNYNIHPKLYPA